MTSSLLLLGLAWTLPLGFLGWSYYRQRYASQRATTCQTTVETVHVDADSGAWMVTSDAVAGDSAAPSPSVSTDATHSVQVARAQAVVRVQTPSGETAYRRCEPFLN